MRGVADMVIHLLQPVAMIWWLLGLWCGVQLLKKRWRMVGFPGLVWLYLSLMTCTPTASLLMLGLEGRAEILERDVEPADAIVCLGGGAEPSAVEPAGFHLNAGGDRLMTALTLFGQGKAPVLVLSGGGYKQAGVMYSEADQVLKGLEKWGLNVADMMSLGVCENTRDEALKVAALMKERGWNRVILVTSSFHMPRASGTFVKAGVPVSAEVRCNYLSSLNRVGDLRWFHLPHAEGFTIFRYWLHEVIGTWVYAWRGWM
jgi:uncharacterized SAM-binding protein YcdF (DUF218 family)